MDTHTYIRTEVISRNQARALFKNDACVKRVFDGREEFIRRLWKGHVIDIISGWFFEGTYYLFSKQVNGHQGDGFSSMGGLGARMCIIKLAMADTYDWWHQLSGY